MALTETMLALLFSFLGSAVFWLVLSVALDLKGKNIIISMVFLTVLIFGISVVFDITAGLVHIWNVATVALFNQSFNVFTLGALLALAGIVSLIGAAITVLINRATS